MVGIYFWPKQMLDCKSKGFASVTVMIPFMLRLQDNLLIVHKSHKPCGLHPRKLTWIMDTQNDRLNGKGDSLLKRYGHFWGSMLA